MTEIETENAYNERFQFGNGIKRVTAGHGGEAILIIGLEKTALIDCGMAYCGETLAENIKQELGDRPLDYVFLSHTHYDHIGGLPYLRKVWPELISIGAPYGKKVLEKDSALKQIELMSKVAWKEYSDKKEEPCILMDGLRIDRAVSEKDCISLGGRELHIIETPGHTNCSLSFILEPEMVLFPSETIGVYIGNGIMVTGMLKSCRDTLESIEKCRKVDALQIIVPHYGRITPPEKEIYWDMAEESLKRHKDFILKKKKEGASFGEIMEEYTKEFYIDFVSNEQPKEAFLLNAQHMIHNLIREFQEI